MAQFTLNWFNTAVIINPNVTGQRAVYRQKSVGGAFISTGFTPPNDLPKTASTTTSPVLANNIVWEFKVQAICTEGGPTDNDNLIQEGLKFSCLVPLVTAITTGEATITLNVLGLDITQATFIIHLASDNSIEAGPTTVARVGNSITFNASGLTDGAEHYIETILYAIVNGSQIQSNDPDQIGDSCFSDNFETVSAFCEPCSEIDASVIEV